MMRPFTSLYVHVPFCAAKCDYCAFYSIPGASAALRQAYLKRLAAELAASAPLCAQMQSIYVGGGTPSFLTVKELEALLSSVLAHVSLATAAEFTVECTPDSLTAAKVGVLARHGVNRVSLGIQSFSPKLRRTIGRRGSLDSLARTLELLRANGITNIGMDLIYAIPGQTLGDWRSDLCRAIGAGVQHLSTYELTVEEGARLGRGRLPPVDEELSVAMWEEAAEVTSRAGLRRYEVSNLARPGYECRHNSEIWHGGTYLGVGPAASSFDGEVRRANRADLEAWLEGAAQEEDHLLPPARAAEILALGLRTTRGWTQEEFLSHTGVDYLELRAEALRELARDGLLEVQAGGVIRPTSRGLLFADRLARRLLD